MFVYEIEASDVSTVEKELDGILEIDPRIIQEVLEYKDFEVTYVHDYKNGKTMVRITRDYDSDDSLDGETQEGWENSLYIRVYDPSKEVVPSFKSETYNYLGLKNERAPVVSSNGYLCCEPSGVNVVVDKSVKVIKREAFAGCEHMVVCELHDDIEEIEDYAFYACRSLMRIKLPKKLKWIGDNAFAKCDNLQSAFIPSSVEFIGDFAFYGCEEMKVLSLPPSIEPEQIGDGAFKQCTKFFRIHQIEEYDTKDWDESTNHEEVHEEIIDAAFYSHPPLHRTCLETNVSAQAINDCIQAHGREVAHIRDHNGMNPLHILVMNPYADSSALFACFKANMNAVFENTAEGFFDWEGKKTPLDYFICWSVCYNVEGYLCLIRELCLHREAHMNGQAGAATGADDSINTNKRKFGSCS